MAITVNEPSKWSVEMGATADINEILRPLTQTPDWRLSPPCFLS